MRFPRLKEAKLTFRNAFIFVLSAEKRLEKLKKDKITLFSNSYSLRLILRTTYFSANLDYFGPSNS